MARMTNAELHARIAELEGENARLREAADAAEAVVAAESGGSAPAGPRTARAGRGRGRTAAAVVLVVVGLLLAPVAVVTSWARAELVDTDRFVATFAPVAEDPAVQSYIAAQVTAAIENEVDIPQLTSDVFDGIRSLDLPPRAEQALGLLEAPAVQGLQSLVAGVVDRIVTSEAFADIWANALRVTHRQFVAAMQNDPNAALEIGDDGSVSVQIGPIIEAVKERLVENGVGFAAQIPVIEKSIVVAQDDAFVFVSTVYALAVAVGTWLPWVAILFLVAGVFVARRRPVALFWTAGGLTLIMALLAAGFDIGRLVFLGAVSPTLIPAGAATAIYGYITEAMASTTAALVVLGLLVTIIAWFAGPWRPARALRGFAGSGFAALRRTAAAHGLTTGAFGIALDRARGFVYGAIALVAAAVLMLNRPVTTGAIWGTIIGALVAVLLVELLRRPADEIEADASVPATSVDPVAVGGDADTAVLDADTAVLDVDRQETEPLDNTSPRA